MAKVSDHHNDNERSYSSSDQRIIDAVRAFNSGWENTNYKTNWSSRAGKGRIYTISFKGQDSIYYENYVFVVDSEIRVFKYLDDLIKGTDIGSSFFDNFFSRPSEFIRTVSLAAISIILVIAMCFIAAWRGQDLEPLIAFAGLVVGYLAGKAT